MVDIKQAMEDSKGGGNLWAKNALFFPSLTAVYLTSG